MDHGKTFRPGNRLCRLIHPTHPQRLYGFRGLEPQSILTFSKAPPAIPHAMEQEPRPFKSFVGLPARLNAEQAAAILGFQTHDMSVLIAAGLLKPLGKPVQNSVKYFATAELEGIRQDVRWLGRATDAVQARWRRKNGASGDKRRTDTTTTAA